MIVTSRLRRHGFFYLLLAPGILYFFVFHYLPMFGVIIAFKDILPFEGLEGVFRAPWVGLKHFRRFLSSYYFVRLMRNTISISLLRMVFGFPAPIVLALMFNEVRNRKYLRVSQTISYLPHFMSAVILASLVRFIFSVDHGPVNGILEKLGREPVFFLQSPRHFVAILVGSGVWQGVGWGSIIYLAAITGIDQQLYQAAIIDGAGKIRQMLHITLPGISAIISIMLILSVGNILNAGFEQIYLLYSPSVYEVADIIDTYVFRDGIENSNYSFATAVGLFKSVIAVFLIGLTNRIANKLGYEGIW